MYNMKLRTKSDKNWESCMEYVQVRQHTLHFMVKRYRAEVVTINQDGTVQVKYVDYGKWRRACD